LFLPSNDLQNRKHQEDGIWDFVGIWVDLSILCGQVVVLVTAAARQTARTVNKIMENSG